MTQQRASRHPARVRAFILAAVAACAAAARPAPAGSASDRFGPADVARLRAATSARMSPDGRRIAYTLAVPRDPLQGKEGKDGPAWMELHVVDTDGTSRGFVTGEVNVSSIRWTGDGAAVAFLARRGDDEHRGLYLIPADGGEARRIVKHEASLSGYSFSPDGKRVAFLAPEPEDAARKKEKEKGFDRIVYEEELRPVRVWIAPLPGGAGGGAGGRGDDPPAEGRMLPLEGSASSLHWSPDGSRIALALAPTPLVDDSYMRRRVRIVDPETGAVLRKIDNPGKLGPMAWSPDGTYLAMISAADPNDPSAGRLMAARAGGGGGANGGGDEGALRDLLPGYEIGSVSAIAWQDADTVMFVGDEGVDTFLSKVNADGSGLKNIVPTGGPVILSSIDLAGDGMSGAFLGQAPDHPTEVYTMKHGDAAPRRLTDSNPWLSGRRLAPQEAIRYRARDGLELEGILIHPLDEAPGKRYPLILGVHGGPESHVRNGWLTRYASPGQLAAARGFAVFHPNYRGSTGRGVAFSKMSQGDAAGKEFDDLVDAVDHLVSIGLADPERVGITGGSYGGYASAWGATYYSDRFAASVMFVGISDDVSKMGTTDIPYEMYMVHHRKWLFDDWDYFRMRSPIFHARKGHTPLLIMHGKEDPRVHPSQSMELYRQIKLLGKAPVRLVFYPGEGHGNRRAASRIDYNLRMMRWFEHYLVDPGRRDAPPPPPALDYEAALGRDKKKEEEKE